MEIEQFSVDAEEVEVASFEKRKKRRRRRRRSKKQSASSSSENSDGDDVSSCIASREGISGDGEASSDAGGEASSVSTELSPEFGSPDYWDYKRAQLKIMVADRDKNRKKISVFNVQRSQSDSGTHPSSKYIANALLELPSLFLNREVFVAVGGTSRAHLHTSAPPNVDVNLQISCPDLNILPSIIHLPSGDDKTRQFLFRASRTCIPGKKTLSVDVSGFNVEPATFTVDGISVVEAIDSVSLVDPPCILAVDAKRQGVMLCLNHCVMNAPLKASFESTSLAIVPEHFIIPPGSSKLGPFAIQSKPEAKIGDAKLTVVLSGLSEDAQVNIPNNPHRLEVYGLKISKPITSVKLEPPLERFVPGTMAKAKVVVNAAPLRNTNVQISPPNGITVSAAHLLLRAGSDRTEAIFFQSSSDIKPGLYTIPIDLISFSNSVEKRLCFKLAVQIYSTRNRSSTGVSRASDDQDTSSEMESLSVVSHGSRISNRSSPRKADEKSKKDDVSLEQLKHLLSDLQEQRAKLKGPNHLRKRNRVKRRIKAIQQRIMEMEREQEKKDDSESEVEEATKRDPLRRKPPFVSSRRGSRNEKRDPARSGSTGLEPPGTIFERRRMSLPAGNSFSDTENSDDVCKSEIIFNRRPPRGVDKSSGSFELSPQVFTEMMDLPMLEWNTQHVCCWLHSLGMSFRKYVRLFQESGVVGKELLELRDEQLRNMGVTSEPHRKRILDELKQQCGNSPENPPNELMIKNNVTNKLERDPPAKASLPPSERAAKESNPLFIIKPNITSIEINNQIKQLQEYQKKLKGSNRKRNKRRRCLQTIQKLEMLMFDVADAEASPTAAKNGSDPPLSEISPLIASVAPSDPATVRTDTREMFKTTPSQTRKSSSSAAEENSRPVKELAFKTPKKSTESFRFQDSLFKDSDKTAFTTLKKEYQHSNIQTQSDHDMSKSAKDLSNDANDRQANLDKAMPFDMRDDISVSSMTLSELDDSEEFNAKLFTTLYEEEPSDLTSEDGTVHSEPATGGSRRHAFDYQTDEEDSSENDFSEISYGTPGYWAFKRRQLQEMASKRKRRLQDQAKNHDGVGLDMIEEQLQTRLRYLTIQKKQFGGSSRHKRFRVKIAKQIQTIQKRISQLHQAKRMRMTRLLDAQRKRKFEEENVEDKSRAQQPAMNNASESKPNRTEKVEKAEEVRFSESTGREKRKRLEVEPLTTAREPESEKSSPPRTRSEAFYARSPPPPETPPRPVPPETRKPLPPLISSEPPEKKKKTDFKIPPRPVPPETRKPLSPLILSEPPEKKKKDFKIDTSVKEVDRMPANLDLLLSPSTGKTMGRAFQTRVRAQSNVPSTPENPSVYASATYWNNRYRKRKQTEEWYEGYKQLKSVLERYISRSHLILDLGCGDSSVQDAMREEGYEILACDISTVVLERLSNQSREMITVDAYNLPFTNSSFDVIFDKGTLDALSCNKSRDLKNLFEEIHRVLRPNGKYIVITPWNAPKRLPQLSCVSWRIQHEAIAMSLQTLATQRFNQLTDHPQFGRDKDTLMAMSYRQAAEQLEKLDLEEEKKKPPGQSCVMHCYVCVKVSRPPSSV